MRTEEANLDGGYEDILKNYDNILDADYDNFFDDGHDTLYSDHEDRTTEDISPEEGTTTFNPKMSTFYKMLIGAI